MAHHPDKFLDGNMMWRGRIYSPLPFVRSLSGERINAGVWGTAGFPSVYRTDVHPFAFLPHSVRWQVLSIVFVLAGFAVTAIGGHTWAAWLLLSAGLTGIAATLAKNLAYALRSDVDSLQGNRLWYRSVVAYLHFLQPFARLRGQIRGILSPPEVAQPVGLPQTSRGPRPSLREAWRALLLICGSVSEDRHWSETWTTTDRVLSQLTDWLRRSRAVRTIEVDEGWSHDRDVSVLVGRWAWLDVRALVEEHDSGKGLLRLSTYLRPTSLGIASAVLLAAALLGAALTGVALRWPPAGAIAATFSVAIAGFVVWRTAQATAIVQRGVAVVTKRLGMVPMPSGAAAMPFVAPSMLRAYGLRSAAIFLVMIVGIGSGTFMLREAATAQVIGARKGYAGDNGPAIQAALNNPGGITVTASGDVYFADSNNNVIRKIDPQNNITTVAGNNALGAGYSGDYASATRAQFDTPDGLAIAPDGDLIVADSHNDRIRRIDRQTWIVTTIAGSGETGFDGDDGPATDAMLNNPGGVAASPNGDIYIADTLNYRVRMIDHTTGYIHTVAGDGNANEDGAPVGDGGPATSASLNMPSDVAISPNGDIYIADMHHQRIRKIDAKTRIISTVAGNGRWGNSGDGGRAVNATMAGPAGIAVVPDGNGGVTLFIADFYNGRVRAVAPDGIIRDVGAEANAFGAPTRVAFAARGWLYVADSSNDRVVALNIPKIAPNLVRAKPVLPAVIPRKVTG
jgi:sugar lactone lactonase YvrE